MTEQEAIKLLREAQKILFNDAETYDAIFAARIALRKQIPKKPDYEGDGYDENGNLIYDTWICPNCGKHYEVDYDDYNCCPECGQAIDKSLDWSDENGL